MKNGKRNVVYTDTIKKEFGTYEIEITEFSLEGMPHTCFQTFIDGNTLYNISPDLEDAKAYISGRIWDYEKTSAR